MILKPVKTPSGREIFRLRRGQIGLGLAMLSLVLGLIYWSFDSYQTHDRTRETILAEESGSSALVYVQREAFSLVVTLEELQLGQSTPEDVVVARSTLSQRLNVITSSGQSTYEIAGQAFRDALASLDAQISQLENNKASPELANAVDNLLSETRQLTDKFQILSRTSAQNAVADRAIIDFWQGAISLSALTLGLILFIWVIRDLNRGFGRGFEELEERTQELARAKSDFVAIQALDTKIYDWNKRVEKGENLSHIVKEINQNLRELAGPENLSLSDEGELSFGSSQKTTSELNDVRALLEARLNELISHIQRQSKADLELSWERKHDSLTGLLNRHGMAEAIVSKLANPHGLSVIVADIDLDNFTAFNSSMGVEAGDELLKTVADRLKKISVKEISLGRVSSDEFAVLALTNESEISNVVAEIYQAVNFSTDLFGSEVQVSAAIGWHLAEKDEAIDSVAAKTGAALTSSKSKGKSGSVEEFSVDRHAHLLTSYLEQVAVRNALANGEIVPYLQPIVHLGNRQISGYEVLARWIDPNRGMIPAAEFIASITQGDLLDELFESMLEQVCQYWSKNSAAFAGRTFSVNLDPKSMQMKDFNNRVMNTIKRYSIEPSSLVLEITEQSLMSEENIILLEQLRDLGIRFALDDFGTGYSSLSRLSSLPIDILKLDRSFIAAGLDSKAETMLQTIMELANQSELLVTVEGIEDEATAEKLTQMGFHFGQGYLFGRPAQLTQTRL